MKALVILTSILFSINFSSFSQNNFTILFGNGFDSLKVTLIIGYRINSTYQSDTLLFKEELNSEYITGLTKQIEIKIPKKEIKEIKLILSDKVYNYRFDRIRKNSQLKIEMFDGIDFCLYQKNKFKFY